MNLDAKWQSRLTMRLCSCQNADLREQKCERKSTTYGAGNFPESLKPIATFDAGGEQLVKVQAVFVK